MEFFTNRKDLKSHLSALRSQGKSVGFVPTMGALHEGHGKLLEVAKSQNEVTVLSIFVNPKQFAPNEDLARYPRTLDSDMELARRLGCGVVFCPTVDEMYPQPFLTQVRVDPKMGGVLCGQYRAGHFDGVCTVVLLLLNLVSPNRAYFGLKDFQQFSIIQKIVSDLGHPSEVVGVPTVRGKGGLALSSRNRFLSESEFEKALCIPRALAAAFHLFEKGEKQISLIFEAAQKELMLGGVEPQYFEMRDASNLELLSGQMESKAVLAIAAYVGSTRLIDNVVLAHEEPYVSAALDLVRKATNV
jgi:pantoate--beta-alanine ligase